jgi:rRNA maturation endonuclease Nob1
MQCQSCGANLRKAAHFCPVCGEESFAATGLLTDNAKQTNLLESAELAQMLNATGQSSNAAGQSSVNAKAVGANAVANTNAVVAAASSGPGLATNKAAMAAAAGIIAGATNGNAASKPNIETNVDVLNEFSSSPQSSANQNNVAPRNLTTPNATTNAAIPSSVVNDSIANKSVKSVATNSIAPVMGRAARVAATDTIVAPDSSTPPVAATARPVMKANLLTTGDLPGNVAGQRELRASLDSRAAISNSKALNCRTCQQELKPQAKFCSNCGASVKPPLFWQLQQLFLAKLKHLQNLQDHKVLNVVAQNAVAQHISGLSGLLLLAAGFFVLCAVGQFWLPGTGNDANSLVVYHLRSIELLLVALILVGTTIALHLAKR